MKNIFTLIILTVLTITFSSCAIEGEEISGIWYTNGALGKMKIEIKPSNGTFVGYILEQENGGKLTTPSSGQEIVFDGLEFNENKYLGGQFLRNPKGRTACEFKMSFYTQDKKTMRAAHNCNGENRLEYFKRDGYPEKPVIESRVSTISLDDLLKANPNNKKN